MSEYDVFRAPAIGGRQLKTDDGVRIGQFLVRTSQLHEPDVLLQWVMQQMLVLRTLNRPDISCVEYMALSTYFDLVSPGSVAPWYEVVFSTGFHGNRRMQGLSFKRQPKAPERPFDGSLSRDTIDWNKLKDLVEAPPAPLQSPDNTYRPTIPPVWNDDALLKRLYKQQQNPWVTDSTHQTMPNTWFGMTNATQTPKDNG